MSKNLIENKEGLNVTIIHKGTSEDSRIFCDKIEYIHNKNGSIFDHHLMFWNKEKLVFKVWLPNSEEDKEFNDVYEALNSVGIKILKK